MRAWTRSVCVWLIIAQIATPVWAGPLGGSVAAGQATIGGAGAITEVHQSTDRAVVNWQSFSTAAGESVRFVQPSAASVTLNRVTGSAASALNGGLSANGRVFISNPNGIHFGATSRVNVGSLVASTLAISNDDFMRGNHRFTASGQAPASVVNDGHITAAPGGTIALVAPVVANNGTISAPGGRVTLAAGSAAQVDLDSGLVRLEASGTAPRDVVAGTDGGANPLAQVVNNGALVEAGGVVEQNGRVILKSAEGVAVQAGTIEAKHVVVDSTQTSVLTDGSVVRANETAQVLSRGHAASLAGSKVEVPGGFIEVSGKKLSLKGRLDTRGDDGRAGRLLIDPVNIVIKNAPDGGACTVVAGDLQIQAITNRCVTLRADNSIEIQTSLDLLNADFTLEIVGTGACSTGNISAATGITIEGVNNFTIRSGEENRPVSQGVVNLGGVQFGIIDGNVDINVFAGTASVITLPVLIAQGGSIHVSGSGAIESGTGGLLCASNVTLAAPRIGTSATPILVNVNDQLTLLAATQLFVNNATTAADLNVQVQDVINTGLRVNQFCCKSLLEAVGCGQLAFSNSCGGSDLNFTLAGANKNLCISACMGSFNLCVTVADGRLEGTVSASQNLSLTSRSTNGVVDILNQGDAENVTVHVRQAVAGAIILDQCSSITEINACDRLTTTAGTVLGNLRVITDVGDVALSGLQSTGRVEIEARGGDIRVVAANSSADEFVLEAANDIRTTGSRQLIAPCITLDAGGAIGAGGSGLVVVDASNQLNLIVDSTDGIAVFLANQRPQSLNITLAGPATPITIQDIGEEVLGTDCSGTLRSPRVCCGLVPLTGEASITQQTGDLSVGELLADELTLEASAGQIIVAPGELITADELTLNAASGIATTDLSPVRVDVDVLTVESGSGTVLIQAEDALRLVSAQVGGGGLFDLTTLTGAITLDFGIIADRVNLTALGAGGEILTQAAGTLLVADEATLTAFGSVELATTRVSDRLTIVSQKPGVAIEANFADTPDELELDFGAGSTLDFQCNGCTLLVLDGSGSIRTQSVADFDLDITARGGNLTVGLNGTVGQFGTTGDLTIRTPDGALDVSDGTSLVADDLQLQANDNITTPGCKPVVVQADTLRADSLVGDVSIAALGNLRLRDGTAGGSFTLTSSGSVRLEGDVTAGGALSITVANALTDTGGTDHVLAGASASLFGRELGTANRPLTLAAPQLSGLATGSAFLRDRLAVNATAFTAVGDLALQGLADITVGSLAGATVQVQSFGGRVLDGNGAAVNVTAIGGTAGFFATAGIGTAADAIETNASAIIARTIAGDISLAEANDVLLTASAAGDVRVSSDGGWLVLNAVVAGGRAELRAAAGGLIDANGAAVNVTAQSLLVALADAAGTADDALELAVGSLDATAFGVFVEVNGPLRVDQLTSTFTNRIRATGDVTLGRLASSQGIVDVISVNGSILDGNGAAANLVVTSGGENRLIAGGTIGVGDALEVDLGFLSIAAGNAAGGVSAQIDGTIAPFNFVNILEAPGAVLFNGRVQGTGAPVVADTPEAAALRTADPAQSLGASFAAQGNPSAADAAGSSTDGPREPSDLIDSSAAND